MRANQITIFALTINLMACGPATLDWNAPLLDDGKADAPTTRPWVNQKPTVLVASPPAVAVGDTLTLIGQDFVEALHGQTLVHFKGTFYDDQGQAHPVDLQAKAQQINSTKLRWKMWPDVVFVPGGNRLGRFVGALTVSNVGNDQSKTFSAPLPVAITIKPSLIARVVNPRGAGCSSIVNSTLGGAPMQFAVEALGLRRGTKEMPTVFRWTFPAEQWKVSFNNGTLDPSSIVPKNGGLVVEDHVADGTGSAVSGGEPRSFLIKVKDDLIGNSRLKELRAKEVPPQGNSMPASVHVVAIDASGKTARLAIALTINRPAEMIYDGKTHVAERFAPLAVSDCIPGGDIGREVSYNESNHETRSRSMAFNFNANASLSIAPLGLIPGLGQSQFATFGAGLNFSAGFGVNVNQEISSTQSKSLSLQGQILPGTYGAFYRQTTKTLRIGKLVGHTICGATVSIGDAVLTDWIFTPDLAVGSRCRPTSNLKPAQTFDRL